MVKLQEIQPKALAKTLGELKTQGYELFKAVTAVDYGTYLEVVYILYNLSTRQHELIGVKLPVEAPEIETVVKLFPAADWFEREMSEMFGIKIKGRKTDRLLLKEWNGAEPPLRKSFKWQNRGYKTLD
ncbi:MAG TPA: NADH-quinone oxidoreductase subunit C [Candidatus Acidoferrales bacterium]|nr:NADH-quinone oxidoreductase subunit C [Candidatus Acidoferrales bacterium]